jgi:hypothetical protein
MYSNQNLAINGAAITDMSVAPVRGEQMIKAQQGYLDSSILLSSFVELDPMRNMIMLQNKWDERVPRKTSFASSIYKKVVGSNAVLNVNGQDGSFKYKMAVETDNCFRTVEDTSDQSPDGYVGASGTSFRIVLNKKLSPFQTLTVDKAFSEMFLLVQENPEPAYVGNGYEHYVTLLGSELDKNLAYPVNLLKSDTIYQVASGSYIAELSEKLGIPHLPDSTNYMEAEFKLGSGQGYEHWFTGKADSYKLQTGYTTADTQNYLQELISQGMDDTSLAIIKATLSNGNSIVSAADLLELLTIRTFNEKFNSSLMFMKAAKISTAKGVIEFNEGLWQQMRRGKIFTYNKKGGLTEADLSQVRNYVYKYNDSRIDETYLHIEAGTELADNIERIIERHGLSQISNIAPFLGAQALLPGSSPVSGTWDALVINPVQIKKAKVPGVGMLSVNRDATLDHIDGKIDNRLRGINPGGKDHTTYSGYIWDVEDQMFSSNGKLPEGTQAVGKEMYAKHNVYLVRPERNPIVWGRNTGRYSSRKASDIAASSNLMGEGFFIYGFGAMWMPDPSKFVMIELKNRYSGIR